MHEDKAHENVHGDSARERRISLKEVQESAAYKKLSGEERRFIDSQWSSRDYRLPLTVANLRSWIRSQKYSSSKGAGSQWHMDDHYDEYHEHFDEYSDLPPHTDSRRPMKKHQSGRQVIHKDGPSSIIHLDLISSHWDEAHEDNYNDCPHGDEYHDYADDPYTDVHSDHDHWDEYHDSPHGDGSHADGGHSDVHGDEPGPHGDHVEHGDETYNDFHYDVEHRDYFDSYLPGERVTPGLDYDTILQRFGVMLERHQKQVFEQIGTNLLEFEKLISDRIKSLEEKLEGNQ